VDFGLTFQALAGTENIGQVNVGATPHESRRHHTDNRPDLIVQAHLHAKDARISAELTLPNL
jgi:hypothetical protein